MTMKIGDIDVVNDIIDAQFRISTLEFLLEDLLKQNSTLLRDPAIIENARNNAVKKLQQKYPSMGLKLK